MASRCSSAASSSCPVCRFSPGQPLRPERDRLLQGPDRSASIPGRGEPVPLDGVVHPPLQVAADEALARLLGLPADDLGVRGRLRVRVGRSCEHVRPDLDDRFQLARSTRCDSSNRCRDRVRVRAGRGTTSRAMPGGCGRRSRVGGQVRVVNRRVGRQGLGDLPAGRPIDHGELLLRRVLELLEQDLDADAGPHQDRHEDQGDDERLGPDGGPVLAGGDDEDLAHGRVRGKSRKGE